eukprot:gene18069-biopygen20415
MRKPAPKAPGDFENDPPDPGNPDSDHFLCSWSPQARYISLIPPGRNGCARVRSASGPRPFVQILSCAPRPVRVRSASAAVFPWFLRTNTFSHKPAILPQRYRRWARRDGGD